MDYYIDFKAHEGKLDKLLTEHGLVYTFRTGDHPITLTISRNAAPEEQMSMLLVEGATSSPGSKLVFIFDLDSIEVNTFERLVISDKLFTKIKGLAKKMYDSYCHAYFADTVANHRINENMVNPDNTRFDDFYTEDDDSEQLPVIELPDTDGEEEVDNE